MNHYQQPTLKCLAIPLASGKVAYVHAGPTREKPVDYGLVKCAIEIPIDYVPAYDLGCNDFQTFDTDAIEYNLPDILRDLEDGKRKLYVGCMGGTGRTGTLLALLVAQHPQFTGEAAVAYVRANYKAHAVETQDQYNQVLDLAGLFEASAPFTHVSTIERAPTVDWEAMGRIHFDEPLPILTRRARLWSLLTGFKT